MSLVLRRVCTEDARRFLEVHHAAVRGIAVKDYPQAVIEDWAPLPITDDAVSAFLANPHHEYRIVAEIDREIVGIGGLVVQNRELSACYVDPSSARRGVGTAIVHELERVARLHGLSELELDSTLTAEAFYAALGYTLVARGDHVLHSGRAMASVRMQKKVNP
jgi:putative acetyltransferase